MTTLAQRRGVTVLAALITLGALTSCAPEPVPAASARPSASPSVTADPVEEVEVEAPTPVIDLDCTDLPGAAELSAVLVEPVTLQNRLTNIDLDADVGPTRYSLRSIGGIECEWSNGQNGRIEGMRNTAFVGATVRVLPDGEAGWQRFTQYGYDPSGAIYCNPAELGSTCRLDALLDGRWLETSLIGVTDGESAAVRVISDTIVAAVAGAATVESTWVAPVDTVFLTDPCADLVTADQAHLALGSDEEFFFNGVDGGYSMTAAAWDAANGHPCPWSGLEIGSGPPVVHHILMGADWAWADATEAGIIAGEPLGLGGLEDGEAAYLQCPEPTGRCIADILVAHDWVRFSVYPDGELTPRLADKAGTLTVLAQYTVDNLRG